MAKQMNVKPEVLEMYRALKVITKNPAIVGHLANTDPKALEQCEKAVDGFEKVYYGGK